MANSAWQNIDDKLNLINKVTKSLKAADILDRMFKRFREDEISLIIENLQDLIQKVFNITEQKPWNYNPYLYDNSSFQKDINAFQRQHPQLNFLHDQFKIELFVLSLLANKEQKIVERLIKHLFPMYRSLGVLFCQTLCHQAALDKATKILKEVPFNETLKIMIRAIREMIDNGIAGPPGLNIIHMISACGYYTASIIDHEMKHEIDLSWTNLQKEDGEALGIAIHHCHYLQMITMHFCELGQEFLCEFRKTILSSKVKIITLDVSHNKGNFFQCLGMLVREHGIQKLVMQFCGLNFNKLDVLTRQSGKGKIHGVDISNNSGLGIGELAVLSVFMNNQSVKSLVMQCCGLNCRKPDDFELLLIKVLLLPCKYLDISQNNIAEEDISQLQEDLSVTVKNDLKVKINDSCCLYFIAGNPTCIRGSIRKVEVTDTDRQQLPSDASHARNAEKSVRFSKLTKSSFSKRDEFLQDDSDEDASHARNAEKSVPFNKLTKSSVDTKHEFIPCEDWTELSPSVFMYNVQPLRTQTEVYHGVQYHANGAKHDVAVKLLKYTSTHLNEVTILLKLAQHRNVVRILESGVFMGAYRQIFIVMELCHENLREFIEHNSFHLSKAEMFFEQTLHAVIFIHSNEIIHRDLKPDNILISFQGDIKVSDFGIGKEIPDGRSVGTVTVPGAGTEGFKAPEVYLKENKIGFKADIFSLAISGYYMFTHGQHPFGDDCLKWPVNITNNENLDLSHLPDFPNSRKRGQLADLLHQMLANKRESRPTAKEVLSNQFFQDQSPNTSSLLTVNSGSGSMTFTNSVINIIQANEFQGSSNMDDPAKSSYLNDSEQLSVEQAPIPSQLSLFQDGKDSFRSVATGSDVKEKLVGEGKLSCVAALMIPIAFAIFISLLLGFHQ